MSKSWKKVTIVIASLLCVMIVCLTINVSVDKITGNVLPHVRDEGQQNGGYVDSNLNNGGSNGVVIPQQGADVQNPSGTVDGTQNQPVVNNGQPSVNTPTQAPVQTAENPLSYSKSQLIAYYNKCLNKSYSQSKVNATKTEHVDVSVSGIDIGNLGLDVDNFAQTIISNNTKKNDKPQTMSFTNGRAGDGTAVSTFVLPANLYDGAVRNIVASRNGNGYKVVITLNAESCAHNGTANFNASCAWPLDINVIDFGAAVKIQSCTFNYPGTVLTATIDEQGRVNNVLVEMPLTVANAEAKALGVTIRVGAISGKWTCKNVMSF